MISKGLEGQDKEEGGGEAGAQCWAVSLLLLVAPRAVPIVPALAMGSHSSAGAFSGDFFLPAWKRSREWFHITQEQLGSVQVSQEEEEKQL